MKITEPSRQIDVIHRTDVLVVGAGPGGLAAALAAARAGVELKIRATLVDTWWPPASDDNEYRLISGV